MNKGLRLYNQKRKAQARSRARWREDVKQGLSSTHSMLDGKIVSREEREAFDALEEEK